MTVSNIPAGCPGEANKKMQKEYAGKEILYEYHAIMNARFPASKHTLSVGLSFL
jgi:hypothetical protein